MMLASGTWFVITRFVGSTTRELGAIPKLHIIEAPMQTCKGIRKHPLSCAIHCMRAEGKKRHRIWGPSAVAAIPGAEAPAGGVRGAGGPVAPTPSETRR